MIRLGGPHAHAKRSRRRSRQEEVVDGHAAAGKRGQFVPIPDDLPFAPANDVSGPSGVDAKNGSDGFGLGAVDVERRIRRRDPHQSLDPRARSAQFFIPSEHGRSLVHDRK
jgi:hypothetical protein